MIHISDLENMTLTCLMFAKEVWGAFWSHGEDEASGPDGFPPLLSSVLAYHPGGGGGGCVDDL